MRCPFGFNTYFEEIYRNGVTNGVTSEKWCQEMVSHLELYH